MVSESPLWLPLKGPRDALGPTLFGSQCGRLGVNSRQKEPEVTVAFGRAPHRQICLGSSGTLGEALPLKRKCAFQTKWLFFTPKKIDSFTKFSAEGDFFERFNIHPPRISLFFFPLTRTLWEQWGCVQYSWRLLVAGWLPV